MTRRPFLTIKINTKWHQVHWNMFRSWSGPRRMFGKRYVGPVYLWGTSARYFGVITS